MKLTLDTHIDAPPGDVFAATIDVPRWPDRITAITAIDMLTDGPIGVGTRFRETRLMFGREATEEMTVAELDMPRRMLLTAESNGCRYRTEHRLEPEGDGTRLTIVFEGVPQTLAARLLKPLGLLMKGALRRAIEGDLADIKRALETRGRPGVA